MIFTNIDTMGVVGHGLSTATHGRKMPVPGQHSCCPHHGRLLGSIKFVEGGETYITIHQGDLRVVAATTWGNRHCLYCHPRPEDARSGATRLLPTSWVTPHPLGPIKFVEGGEIYITIHQGDLRRFLLATTWGNRHCFYRRPRPDDAHFGAASLLPAP